MKNIKSVLLSGGGVKGMSYIALFKVLEEKKINVENYAGNSIGSFLAFLHVSGFSFKEIHVIFNKFDLTKFNTVSINNMLTKKSLFDITKFTELIITLFKYKKLDPNMTFKELFKLTNKNLFIKATKIETSMPYYFSHFETPNVKVIDSVLASMSIPFVFEEIVIDSKKYCDGFLTGNVPFEITENDQFKELFPPEETLIVIFTSEIILQEKSMEILPSYKLLYNNYKDYFNFFLKSLSRTSERFQVCYMKKSGYNNIIDIKNVFNIETTDFNITKNTKRKYLLHSYKTIMEFFKN